MNNYLALRRQFHQIITILKTYVPLSLVVSMAFHITTITIAADNKDSKLPVKKGIENENEKKNKTLNNAENNPDKELLLFLSEFSDAQGNWIDPEVFIQPQTETINTTIELEESNHENLPNNI